jgi:hypothetical protein
MPQRSDLLTYGTPLCQLHAVTVMLKLVLSLSLIVQVLAAATLAAPATVQLTVRTVDSANQPIPNAYIAVVRNDAPWRAPLAERVTGAVATFDIPPGRYRIVAGAPGFATYFGNVLQLDSAREATVHLVRLGSVGGRVVTPAGAPVAAARVGMFWEFIPDYPRRLSALGEQHLHANTFTLTDADGMFELPAGIGHSDAVIVEADHKVPRLIDGVSAGSSALAKVELQEGGSLTLHVTQSGRAGWLRLAPAAGQALAALPLERALTLWARPNNSVITWRSLPAMKLDVLFEPDDGSGDVVALKTVAITRGEDTVADAALPAPAALQAESQQQVIRFAPTGKAIAADRLIVKRWSSAGATPLRVRVEHVSGGEVVVVNAPCIAGDRFTFESPRLLGASTLPGSCAEPPAVTLHDRATLRFKLSPPLPVRLPRTGVAAVSDCDTKHLIADVPFLINDDGAATLLAPAGCIAVRATAGKFAPVEWPRLDLAAAAQRDLGLVKLGFAASLLVHVSAPDGRPAEGVTVSAERVDDLVPLRNVLDVAAVAPIARGLTDAKGWLALNGIPEGRIVLVLRRAGVEYPQLSDVVRITGDSRRTLDVTLEDPGRIVVFIERPRDIPDINVASLELLPLPDNRWPHALAFRARPNSDGPAEFKSVPPGRWRVTARGVIGQSTLTSLGSADVTVTPGASIAQTITLQAVAVRGHVMRSGVPVAGILTLKPLASGIEPLTTKIDSDGAFVLVAPTPGDYRPIVAEPGKQTTAARSPVHIAHDHDSADLEITLPAGRIEGRAVDEHGQAVRGAHVSGVTRVTTAGTYEVSEVHAVSREDGSFAIDGVRDGQWSLTASTDQLSSEPVVLSLADGEVRTGATLRLHAKNTLTGKLLGPDGAPVAGAVVSATLPPPLSDLAAGLVVRTDPNGEFTFSPPPGAPDIANVVVRTSDRVAMATRMKLSDGMTITLPAPLGALRLTNASGKWSRDALAFHALVAPDGAFLNPLAGGALASDGTRDVLTTARVPAQQYRYVVARTPNERALLESGSGALLPALRTITVQPNAVIDVNVGDPPTNELEEP